MRLKVVVVRVGVLCVVCYHVLTLGLCSAGTLNPQLVLSAVFRLFREKDWPLLGKLLQSIRSAFHLPASGPLGTTVDYYFINTEVMQEILKAGRHVHTFDGLRAKPANNAALRQNAGLLDVRHPPNVRIAGAVLETAGLREEGKEECFSQARRSFVPPCLGFHLCFDSLMILLPIRTWTLASRLVLSSSCS